MTDSSMNDFKIEKILGKGSFSTVYLVRRKEDNKIYALKSVILEKLNKKEQQNSVNEVRILASVNHPNVIGYKEAFWDDSQNTLNIVMEFADDGDLQTKITKMRKEGGMFQENLIWSYSIQMIEGLKALHDKKIMHRDLKSANIFLVKDKHQCKLGDMNVSKVIKEKVLLTQTGTPYYASPEVWRDEPYSYKSDLWSIGCVIYELCALRPPFKGKDLDELFMNVCQGKAERISNVYSDDLWKMILMLLQTDVKKRCDCNKFLNSSLITRKIQEMKNENKEYKNLEKNKEINDGKLLETIRFENILDIKRQLPTKKNYSNNNAVLGSDKKNNNIKKINRNKDLNLNINTNDEKSKSNKSNKSNKNINSNNLVQSSNSIKYRKINKNKKIVYNSTNNNKNVKIIEKNKIPIKNELKEKAKENEYGKIYFDIETNLQLKNSPTLNPQESKNSINNNNSNSNNIVSSSLKNSIVTKKHIKNSPKMKNNEEDKAMIYQKPKLAENSVKRDKKYLGLNHKKPMTTKRTIKKMVYMERNITPKRATNKIGNKSENISSVNDKHIISMRNKNIYKSGYGSVTRDKNQKLMAKPIETSPGGNNNINKNTEIKYLNIHKKQNYSKKIQNDISQRPQSATPSKKNAKLNNNTNNILEKNITEIKLDIDNKMNNKIKNNINKNINISNNNNKQFISNRENMVNMLINNYNKNKNSNNFNSYNPNNRPINKNYMERPLTTSNNQKKYNNSKLSEPKIEINPRKIIIKNPSNKVQSREKINFNKKRMVNKNIIERDMTEPELLKMKNPIKIIDQKKEYQKTLNISLNNKEQNAFLQQQKGNKMIRYNTNNNPRYNQYYSNNNSNSNNMEQNNPQIFNNYVSINNLEPSNYPVKIINVFGK